MNKLITSLTCGTILSMSLLGVGNASTVTGDGTHMMNQQGNTMMNQTTGTMHRNETIVQDRVRYGDNTTVSPLSNTTPTGRYRTTSTTVPTTTTRTGSNWGWLGLIGLLGLAGMRSRSGERDRQ
ncbi:WGxxGxxG family protein [Paenibacillus sp. BAC0078]